MERNLVIVALALSGAGLGALVAHFLSVGSWLDAKMYIVGGAVCGYALATVALKYLAGKP